MAPGGWRAPGSTTPGNVVKLWRGDASFDGPDAVEKWSFSFGNQNEERLEGPDRDLVS
jgi:hypothetical protein